MTRLTYKLWNPIINSERTGCSFDVTPCLRGLASGTQEIMDEFLRCLNIEAEAKNWSIETFCSAYYSHNMQEEYHRDRHPMAWRVNIAFKQTYREYLNLELSVFEPIGVYNANDETWEETDEFLEWKRMQYIVIADFHIWEWDKFLEEKIHQEPIFSEYQSFESYLIGGEEVQARFNLGIINFPEEEEKVISFLQACEQCNASTNWAKTMHGWI